MPVQSLALVLDYYYCEFYLFNVYGYIVILNIGLLYRYYFMFSLILLKLILSEIHEVSRDLLK